MEEALDMGDVTPPDAGQTRGHADQQPPEENGQPSQGPDPDPAEVPQAGTAADGAEVERQSLGVRRGVQLDRQAPGRQRCRQCHRVMVDAALAPRLDQVDLRRPHPRLTTVQSASGTARGYRYRAARFGRPGRSRR